MANATWDRTAIDEFTPNIAFRLQHVGIDPDLARRLARCRIPIGMVERMYLLKMPWPLVSSALDTSGVQSDEDARGLIGLWSAGFTEREILLWARLGSLEAAFRLASKDVNVRDAASFPLAEHSLTDLLKMYQKAEQVGIHHDDVHLWFAGQVLMLSFPYLEERRFTLWRRVAVHSIGSRQAAVACAAGLSPTEAVDQAKAGTFDEHSLRMLAGLRHSGMTG